MGKHTHPEGLCIRPLVEGDLPEADRIMRLAFGTFTQQPDPQHYKGDAGLVIPRWRADPMSAFAAEMEGRLVGSNFVARWGSFGFIGPLSIDPAYWGRGFAKHLVAPTVERLDSWGVQLGGLFTFSQSVKHIGLYQKFGFYPRWLTLVFEKGVAVQPHAPEGCDARLFSQLDSQGRGHALNACRRLTHAIYSGLDPTPEIASIAAQGLGDTVLIWQGRELIGFAACHAGPGTEAGSGACYVKFGAAAPGVTARQSFKKLLSSCEAYAKSVHADRIALGVNTARRQAYEEILAKGYQVLRTGIAMHRPDRTGFSRPEDFVIDDLR